MGTVSANRLGLSVAAVLAGWHAVWLALVASGAAQQVFDFASRLHGMKPDAVVGTLDPGLGALLLVATGAIGYISGFGGAWVWNCVQRFQEGAGSATGRGGVTAGSPRQAA
jgi:hypothetical protein